MMKENYFVPIQQPNIVEQKRLHVARSILLCSAKQLLLQDIRTRKATLTTKLKREIESIHENFTALEGFLPHKELLSEKISPKKLKQHEPLPTKSQSSNYKMEQLQEALSLIEKKIDSLDL